MHHKLSRDTHSKNGTNMTECKMLIYYTSMYTVLCKYVTLSMVFNSHSNNQTCEQK